VLVSEQQVTETLGEIRLRRQDIHRKLLDTSMYAAVLRFVCYGRDMSELSIVIDRVAGNKAKHGDGPSSMFAADDVEMNQDGFSGSPSSGGGGGDQVPFIAASRRNTVIGRYRHGAQSKKLAGGNKNSTKKKKKKKSGISKGNQIKVRDTLREQSGGDLRKLMRQSDQRGVIGKFEMTLDEVRSSIEKKESGGRGSAFEEGAAARGGSKGGRESSHITKQIIKSIKSPALKRRLLRHVKPSSFD